MERLPRISLIVSYGSIFSCCEVVALAVTGVLDDVILVWSRSKEARFDERENPEISIHMCKLFATQALSQTHAEKCF